ncbi:MAG TPA: hypothetical protein VLA89_09315 [Gemmatimonadales bacterium]|nr:hypothetical protein [Gemmatimonadales bacterium]
MSNLPARRTGKPDFATLAQQAKVPDLVAAAISQDDWSAMPTDERIGALEFITMEMQDTTSGMAITFPRIKYPTSGAGVFGVPGPDKMDYVQSISGVVVAKQTVRAYWPVGDAVSNNPPTCSSPDGVIPVEGPGKQNAHCMDCKWAQFGTGKEGSGQACKQRINVFFLRDRNGTLEDIPTLMSVPPSQLKTFSDFAVQLRKNNLTMLSQVVEFSLAETRNKGGIAYMALILKVGRKLAFAEMKEARAIADQFKAQMEKRGLVPDEVDEDTNGGAGQAPGSTPGATVLDHGDMHAPDRSKDPVPF